MERIEGGNYDGDLERTWRFPNATVALIVVESEEGLRFEKKENAGFSE